MRTGEDARHARRCVTHGVSKVYEDCRNASSRRRVSGTAQARMRKTAQDQRPLHLPSGKQSEPVCRPVDGRRRTDSMASETVRTGTATCHRPHPDRMPGGATTTGHARLFPRMRSDGRAMNATPSSTGGAGYPHNRQDISLVSPAVQLPAATRTLRKPARPPRTPAAAAPPWRHRIVHECFVRGDTPGNAATTTMPGPRHAKGEPARVRSVGPHSHGGARNGSVS